MDCKRMVHIAVKKLYTNRLEGDLLMDAPESECWEDLVTQVKEEKNWRVEVKKIKDTICIQAAKGGKKRKKNVKKAEAGAGASAKKSNTDKGKDEGENEGGEKGSQSPHIYTHHQDDTPPHL